MAKFIYTLKDNKGRDYQGTVDAKDAGEARKKLKTTGYFLVALEREAKPTVFDKNIPKKDIIMFFHQSATIMEAGIPIIKSLRGLAMQTGNKNFASIISDMRSKVEGGFKLSEAMRGHPRVFSEFTVTMVEIGEAAGNLGKMLRKISEYLGKEEEVNRKIKSLLAYPIVVGSLTLAVSAYLVTFVVPVFQSVYRTIKVALPLPTVVLIFLSKIIRKWWFLFPLVLAAVIFASARLKKNEKAVIYMHRIKMSIPLFGPLIKKISVSRFMRTLGYMISSGVPIMRALEVAQPITGNKVISGIIDSAKIAVRKGESLSQSLRIGKVFPPLAIQMLSTGEETGSLDEMLVKCSDFLDEEVDDEIKSLTVKIEPVLTFILAAVIGFIALAIYLPMFDIIREITR